MRVLLINPPSKGIYYRLGLCLPPLGLGYLAAVLLKQGHGVDVIDLNTERREVRSLPWKEWDVVGISGDTSRHAEAMAIAGVAKANGRTVVLGGYHATFMDAAALASGQVDYVVRGEGECSFPALLECLSQGGDPAQVEGVSFLDPEGNLVQNGISQPEPRLENLPRPARQLLPMKRYRSSELDGRKLTTMVTSRGCPQNCSFCSSSHFAGTRWRSRAAEDIVDELQVVTETYDYGAVAFMDDNFTLNYRRVSAICREIIRRGLDIKWWCFSRVDSLARHPEMAAEMAAAGARMVFLGLESADEAVLAGYRKGIDTDMAARAVELLKKNGIRVWGSFVLGALNDTKEKIRRTVAYAQSLEPDIAEFSILTPFPGTALFAEAKAKGYIADYNWERYDGAHAVMEIPGLTRREIAWEAIRAYLKFYGRWARLGEVWDAVKTSLASGRGVGSGVKL